VVIKAELRKVLLQKSVCMDQKPYRSKFSL